MRSSVFRHRLLLLAVAVLVAVPALSALGAASLPGDNRRLSGTAAVGDENFPAIAYNSAAEEYLVVWEDDRMAAARGSDIYGRRLDRIGRPLGEDFRICGPSAWADDKDPSVAYNSTANEYLVVWSDRRSYSTRGFDIYARRVSAAGVPLGDADFRVVSDQAAADDLSPDVAFNSKANRYLVVWQDFRYAGTSGWTIFGRLVKPAGTPVGGDRNISGAGPYGSEWAPAVAYDSSADQYLVVWHDMRNYYTRGADIYGRRLDGQARNLAGFRISGAGGFVDQKWPDVTYNRTSQQFLVVWEDGRRDDTRGVDIWGRFVASSGGPAGKDFRVSDNPATGDERYPALAWDSLADRYLVAWQGDRLGGWQVFARRVAAAGAPSGQALRISEPPAAVASYPAVGYGAGAGEFLVVWQDQRDLASVGTDIYGQRVTGG
ncbi:MAG: hypothetical protein JW785_05605 [Acidimicrobiia bacterium]|nr:hypothetical protein [Acidimicrobiia bacterium]